MPGNDSRPVPGEDAPSVDFRLLFEASPTPLLAVAPPGFTCIAVNDAYQAATGVRREDVLGRVFFDLYLDDPADPEATGVRDLRASFERVLATGRTDVTPIQRYGIRRASAAGSGLEERRWMLINSPVHGAGGEIVAIIHRIENVTETLRHHDPREEGAPFDHDRQEMLQELQRATSALARTEAALLESERRRAEAALLETEGKFRAIADLVPDLLWSSDANGSATWYNRRWTEYTGLSEEESLGAGWVEAVHPEDREAIGQAYHSALSSGSPLRHELRLRSVNAEHRWFLLEARPARDESGRISQWFGALTDVHDQRLALEAAQQASDAKSQFLAVMSHELRTPLSGVISYADLLETGVYGPVSADQQVALARIKANSWHLVSIIDEVLTLSQAGAGRVEVRLEETDVAELVREAMEIFRPEAERRGLVLRAPSGGATAPLPTDPGKVRQILINLLGNAVKYTERGEVSAEVDQVTPGWVHVHVRDTGPGIAPEDHERIFQPFTQVDASLTRVVGGTGLGLAVCRDLTRLLGGDITLQSAPGKGSVFTLRLPSAPAQVSEGSAP